MMNSAPAVVGALVVAFSTRGSSSDWGTVLNAAIILSTMFCLRGGRGRAGRALFSRRPRAVCRETSARAARQCPPVFCGGRQRLDE